MKILKTANYEKFSKDTVEDFTVNPWAICNKSTGGKKEEPEKFERCVKKVKKENRKEATIGQPYTVDVEEREESDPAEIQKRIDMSRKRREHSFPSKGRPRGPGRRQISKGLETTDKDMSDTEWDRFIKNKLRQQEKEREGLETAVFAKKETFKIEAKKKWIQDAVKDEGSFTEYCGGNVTQECISKGKNSPDKKTKQRAELAETFREMNKK
jgi:hypothetical protein